MTDEQTPSVEELKDRLKVEIPVEEEAAKGEGDAPKRDVAAELKELGRQFAETVQTAWNSEERHRFESELREGVRSFAGEVDKAIREAKESNAAARMKEEATEVKTKIDTSDIGRKTREGLVQGMHWLSEELNSLADQFTPPEKASEEPSEETEQQ